MRMLHLWLDDASVGCGLRAFLEVRAGTKLVHLLHVPTLTRVAVSLDVVAAQFRRRLASEGPIRRGMIGAIRTRVRDFNRYGKRYPAALVKEALAGLRAERADDAAEVDAALADVRDAPEAET